MVDVAEINLYLLSPLRLGSERRRMSESKITMNFNLDFGPMIAALDKMAQEARKAGQALAIRTRHTERKLKRMQRHWRKQESRDRKSARILARQIARSEHHIRARPLLRNGKAWR